MTQDSIGHVKTLCMSVLVVSDDENGATHVTCSVLKHDSILVLIQLTLYIYCESILEAILSINQ